MQIPELIKVRRSFEASPLADVPAAVRAELERVFPPVPAAAPVAVAVGSRGVANIEAVVRSIVEFLKSRKAAPFIVPAMGSHGGATAEGQREVLASYGVTEARIGAPVRSSMEVVRLPDGPPGFPVFMDRTAWQSYGVVLVNRVKPHTDYHGFPESGLMKMAAIGLGKQAQALVIHARGVEGLKSMIGPAARRILSTGKILLGLGLVENALDQTCRVQAALPDAIEAVERALLAEAARLMPRLPVRDIDVLVIDELGKDISGTGLDTNVIGRIRVLGQQEPDWPSVKVIVVTDLTEASHGNAVGVGLADIVTRRLQRKIDAEATNQNVVTSSFLERAKLPLVAETDRQALEIALRCSWIPEGRQPRMIRIRNTLRLADLYVSRPVLEEMRGREPVEEDGGFQSPLDAAGALVPFGE